MDRRQGFLDFDPIIPPHTLSRSEDPDTSDLAAQHIVGAGKHAAAMMFAHEILSEHEGCTASELDRHAQSREGKVRKRLNDLKKIGMAYKGRKRRCSITQRMAYTWFSNNPPPNGSCNARTETPFQH